VSHCFKFLQLVGMVVDFFINTLTTIVHYNNLLFSTIFEHIYKLFDFLQRIPGYTADAIIYMFYELIIGVPVTIVKFLVECFVQLFLCVKENAYTFISSCGNWCQVVLPLVCSTLGKLLLNILLIPVKFAIFVYQNEMNWLGPYLSSVYQWVRSVPESIYTFLSGISLYPFIEQIHRLCSGIGVFLYYIWENLIYTPIVYISGLCHWCLLSVCHVCRGTLNGALHLLVSTTTLLWDPTTVYRGIVSLVYLPRRLFTSETLFIWIVVLLCSIVTLLVYQVLLSNSTTLASKCPPVITQSVRRLSTYFNIPRKLKSLSKCKQRTLMQ
jgi:hypothetical protein